MTTILIIIIITVTILMKPISEVRQSLKFTNNYLLSLLNPKGIPTLYCWELIRVLQVLPLTAKSFDKFWKAKKFLKHL